MPGAQPAHASQVRKRPGRATQAGGALPTTFQHLAGANLAAQAAEQISLAAVPMVAVLALQAG